MGITVNPRSVSDATRFTQTTPHATSKPHVSPSGSRFGPASSGGDGGSRRPGPSSAPSRAAETPEQRVARLRAAHELAKNAGISRFDRVIDSSRHFFDGAYKITVFSLVGLTVLAGVFTVFTAGDMLTRNRKRKAEFFEAQRKMEADSLAAARLAYMRGDATPEQVELVDYVRAREGQAGAEDGVKMPSILGPPTSARADGAAAAVTASAAGPEWQPGVPVKAGEDAVEGSKSGVSSGWFFSRSSKQDTGNAKNAEGVQSFVQEKAKAAFEAEKQNQKTGGPLDQLGLEGSGKGSKSSGWWWSK